MFREHQRVIQDHAISPQGLIDTVAFVIATQNQCFYRVGQILGDWRAQGLEAMGWLNESQKRGIAYISRNTQDFLGPFFAGLSAEEQILRLVEIPHIGIVKAGFIVQLAHGKIGCLDTHNLRANGLDPRAFRVPTTTESLRRKIDLYCQLCRDIGTCEQLWDGWCRLIAQRYPDKFESPDRVSTYHVECVIGESYVEEVPRHNTTHTKAS